MHTHTVLNQPKPLVDYDMFSADCVLHELTHLYDAAGADALLRSFGAFCGSQQAISWAEQANDNPPVLKTFNRFSERIDQVEYHPSYHQLMQKSIEFGVHSLPWSNPRPGAHAARAAMMYMAFQNEAGHCCPISMTYSVIPSLRLQMELAAIWEPLITSNIYDRRFAAAFEKTGLTVGMALTEKQGGSDLRANSTQAVPELEAGPGNAYRLSGHKWFCSAPMSDAFLMTAKAEDGLSCFLVPRFEPDGRKNNILFQRLKNKLGNRSNASSEIELDGALGWLVSEEGKGVVSIIEMVNHTRLDCLIGSAALMRQATLQALHYCHHRSAFGKVLSKHPLMLNVLADLAIESEAATRLMMRVASSFDRQHLVEGEQGFRRIATTIAKYWVCKRTPLHLAESLECFGGNGYIEEGPMPRLFRESPLLGIWEGSGNIMCLDVLRAIGKEPANFTALSAELDFGKGHSRALNSYILEAKREISTYMKAVAEKDFASLAFGELSARRLVEHLALALQAVQMVKHAPEVIADLFVASRIEKTAGVAFGTLNTDLDTLKHIVARALPDY